MNVLNVAKISLALHPLNRWKKASQLSKKEILKRETQADRKAGRDQNSGREKRKSRSVPAFSVAETDTHAEQDAEEAEAHAHDDPSDGVNVQLCRTQTRHLP